MSVAHTPIENSNSLVRDRRPDHTAWQIDPRTSRVEFTIRKRLLVAPMVVTGRFSDVQGVIALDELDPTTAQASITIGAGSIDTGYARRDIHLRQEDFFHVDAHPTITFRSRRVDSSDVHAGRYTVVGDLTVRGVTREVTLDAHYAAPERSGNDRRIKLVLTTRLNRRHFGLAWNTVFLGVADELTVNLAIEATPRRDGQVRHRSAPWHRRNRSDPAPVHAQQPATPYVSGADRTR
jgi:polyisoprenoid-binding protein YceI